MGKISFKPGSPVYLGDEKFEILKPVDLKQVLAKKCATGEYKVLEISKLKNSPPDPSAEAPTVHIDHIRQKHWNEAKRRFEIIEPLLKEGRSKTDVVKRAEECGVHTVTLYRWIGLFESSGLMSSLVPGFDSRGGKGGHRLDKATESIVKQTIEELYLSRQKLRPRTVSREIRRKCLQAGVPAPHEMTVRNRINSLSKKEVVKKREGRKRSEQIYSKIDGSFPEGRYPLDVIQIDHTRLDITLVDEMHRKPIGRPWITMAIDVFSRVVFGLYVSLDAPGFFTTGQCLLNGIQPKDRFLRGLDVAGAWDIFGLPRTVHADNAKEFRGNDLQRFCEEYGVTLTWRPVARPQYGAHIERLMGTLNEEIHTLPGTTFSDIRQKGDYDSDSRAVMTLTEFERWLVNYIVNVYHERPHSSLDMPPVQKYSEGILGNDQNIGTGLPEIIEDEEKLRMCLLPSIERAIKRDGVVIDGIKYYHDVLRSWINESEGKRKKMFTFRRDPRDISTIFFYDPKLKRYFPIPYRTIAFPPISLWELREVKRQFKEKRIRNYDEFKIFNAYEAMKRIENEAARKTKAVRRKTEAKEFHKKKLKDTQGVSGNEKFHDGARATEGKAGTLQNEVGVDELFRDITPYAGTKVIKSDSRE